MGPCAHATSVILYLSNERYASTKKSTVKIENIYPEPICDESSASSDSDVDNNANVNYDSSDTIIDSDDDNNGDDNINKQVEHLIIYPDLSTIASTMD
jgi:hypothetical protein